MKYLDHRCTCSWWQNQCVKACLWDIKIHFPNHSAVLYWYFAILLCHSFGIPYRNDNLQIFSIMIIHILSLFPALSRSDFVISKLSSLCVLQILYSQSLTYEKMPQIGIQFHSLRWVCPFSSISYYPWSLREKEYKGHEGERSQIGMSIALSFGNSHTLFSHIRLSLTGLVI